MTATTFDRVSARAARAAAVPPAVVLLKVLLAPFWLLAFLAGVAYRLGAFVVAFVWGSLVEGFAAGRAKVPPVRPVVQKAE